MYNCIEYMRILRFVLPFLFVRNWHDGQWELSHSRLMLFCIALFFCVLGIGIAYFLQTPIEYVAPKV